MGLQLIAKIGCMIVFFFEVLIFGRFVSKLSLFQNKNFLSVALSFSGGLFLSISILHIIPESTHKFNIYFLQAHPEEAFSSSEVKQSWYLPLSFIITSITFIIIMFIDKVLIGESHDHQYQLSFAHQPKKASTNNMKELEEIKVEGNPGSQRIISEIQVTPQQTHENMKPFILQAGMGIHAFFQCLAVGIQQSAFGAFSLAIAIFVHKWAEGLTLGLIYKKNGFSEKVITMMILIQALTNVVGLFIGTLLSKEGPLVMAIFMSISAGTFLYISTAEVLLEQFKQPSKWKLLAVVLANLFITSIFFIEKATEVGQN